MKTIMNVELSLGYAHWKKLMLENKVWVVMDVPSMEHMAGVMNKPEMIKIRQEAVAILASQQLIKLVE